MEITEKDRGFMRQAIELAAASVKNGGDWTDATAVGFDDDFIYREMAVPFS